jgi:RNA polymerase sigma factor (sigma-70 family)
MIPIPGGDVMPPPASFVELMQRLEAGDADAAAMVYQRFAHRLLGLARRALSARLQAKVGASDVVQSVFRTFFRGLAKRHLNLDGEDSLWALLAEITLRKCGRWHEHFATRKRSGELTTATLPEDVAEEGPADTREPSPADAVQMLDLLEELLDGLDVQEQLICELRLEEHNVAEIARRAGCTEATVFRKLDRIKRRLRRLCSPP